LYHVTIIDDRAAPATASIPEAP